MATNSFNLIDLYTKVFGIKGVRFAINTTGGNQGEFEYSSLQLTGKPKARAYSVLGTPIYEQITLIGSDTNYTIPDWPLIDITYQKQIIKTPVKGHNGTVKEYIYTDDYQINIRGILINYFSDEYPENLVYELEQTCKINKELRVTSPLLNLLDVHNLVIQDVRYPEVEGYNNIQPFLLQCLSDEPIELVIKTAKNQQKIRPGL